MDGRIYSSVLGQCVSANNRLMSCSVFSEQIPLCVDYKAKVHLQTNDFTFISSHFMFLFDVVVTKLLELFCLSILFPPNEKQTRTLA